MTGDAPEILPPRANPDLVGHSAAEQVLLRAYNSGRLPHAWLFQGPRGIGKATLAYRFARFLLRGGGDGGLFGDAPLDLSIPDSDPVFRRVAAGGHGDLVTLERRPDEKGKTASVISVHESRKVVDFMHKTAQEGGWRIVLVDPVEEMNQSASNALLKVLEEPPADALLLLISHAPGRLLPTIHSRCCHLTLAPLPEETVEQLLTQAHPDLDPEDRQAICRLAEGSIGRALTLLENGGLELYRELVDLLAAPAEARHQKLGSFADRLAGGDGTAFRTATELMVWSLGRTIRGISAGAPPPDVLPGDSAILTGRVGRTALAQWLALWEKISRLFARAEGANLDRKQVVLTAFLEIESLTS